jgi:hypothetical protein
MSNLFNKAALPLPASGQALPQAWAKPRLERLAPGSPAHLRAQAALALACQKPTR